jgi:hypothetical protein
MSYSARQLVDQDLNLGWGASRSDGTGEYADVRFAGPVRLMRIRIAPGYLRMGQRADAGCAVVSSFDRNRHVTAVRYEFDDGSSLVHDLAAVPQLQSIDVPNGGVVTAGVRVVVLGTVRPPGADDDTVISEAAFEGVP